MILASPASPGNIPSASNGSEAAADTLKGEAQPARETFPPTRAAPDGEGTWSPLRGLASRHCDEA